MRSRSPSPTRPVACQRLKEIRLALGMTQSELAGLLGMKQDKYKQYETRTRPPREVMTPLGKLYGIQPLIFLDESEASEAAFDKLIVELRSQMSRKRHINSDSLLPLGDNASVGDAPPKTIKEGSNMGLEGLLVIISGLERRLQMVEDENTDLKDRLAAVERHEPNPRTRRRPS